jgi:hypothetical protein
VAAVDRGPSSCDAGDVDDSAPVLPNHVRDGELGEDEAGSKIDLYTCSVLAPDESQWAERRTLIV